tara:strand:- start:1115 stop:1453 length:339 start_codon:yes stop_codon:yes gene_type:complete
MIELLNMNVHTIKINSYDFTDSLPHGIKSHQIDQYIKRHIVYEWYLTTDLGKHLIRLSDPQNNDIDIVRKWDSDEYLIYISTWLSQEQIDRIELAFFVKLKRKSYRSKYSFE